MQCLVPKTMASELITYIQGKDTLMDKKFYVENRRRVAAHMTGNEAMLFFSGEPVRKSADENFPFFTNRNFLYLTGIKQEQSVLLLLKKGEIISECRFVTKPDGGTAARRDGVRVFRQFA